MRKVLAFFLAVILVFSLATQAFAATVSLETEAASVTAGEQVVVKLTQSEAVDGITAIKYHVYYDNTLFELTSSVPGKNITFGRTGTDGKGFYQVINYLDTTSEGVTIEAGTIAAMTFTALENVTESQVAGITLVNKGVMGVGDVMLEDANLVENGTVSITVSPAAPEIQYYNVTLPENPVGYTIAPTDGSVSPVEAGGSYSFTVTVLEGYEGTPVVKANGTALTLTDGNYTISDIMADQTVTVDGIVKKESGSGITPADVTIYQDGTDGSNWPNAPISVGTLTLGGLAVKAYRWDGDNCYVTIYSDNAKDAAYSITYDIVGTNINYMHFFSVAFNGTTGESYSGNLTDGAAQIEIYAQFQSAQYSGTKTVYISTEDMQEEPKSFEVTLTEGTGYTVAAVEGSTSPVAEGGSFSFTVKANNGYEGPSAVKANGVELKAENGVYTIENIAENQVVTVEGVVAKANMYTVAASEDVTASKGENTSISIQVTGNSDESITGYNDYDVTVSYDPSALTYVSGTGAHETAEIIPNDGNGTIRIVGHGEAKTWADAVAALTFTAKESGSHQVTIRSAKIDNSGNAVAWDAPEAAVSDKTVAVLVAYPVTLPDGFTGELSVLPGSDYQFTAPNDYYKITVTVGGEEVTPEISGLTYTLRDVSGDVVITAVGKTYNVIKNGEKAAIDGAPTAQYGEDYTFTVTADSGYAVTGVSVQIGDANVEYSISNGTYVISGSKITGDVTITATAQQQAANTTQITFEGVEADEVVGGLIQYATNGQDFTFELNEEEGYAYTVKLGETELKPASGVYTIPGNQINGTALTVTISKEVDSFAPEVNVSQYIQLDDTVLWLVTATQGDTVLAYGEGNTMYWSDKYNAYCWLVVSAEDVDAVKLAAEDTIIAAAEDAQATAISYDLDVNQSGAVDINDAQLTYDMYQAKLYSGFDVVSMDRFLEADIDGNKAVNVDDADDVVEQVVK